MASTALVLAVLGWLHLLNPYLILACVFLLGVGFAANAPAWTSIVRQTVSDAELPSTAILGSLQFSIAGIIGPALGGFLGLARRSEFSLCAKCRRLPLNCFGNSEIDTTDPAGKAFIREPFRVF